MRRWGKSIDKIDEYEPIEEGEQEFAQFADNIPERDQPLEML